MTQPDSTTNTGAVEALKPCPFCSSDLYWSSVEGRPYFFHPGVVTDDDCVLAGKGFAPSEIPIWNTRATSEAEVIERCAKVADDAHDKFLATYEVEYNRKRYDVPSMDRARKKAAGIISEDIAADIRALSPAKEPRDD